MQLDIPYSNSNHTIIGEIDIYPHLEKPFAWPHLFIMRSGFGPQKYLNSVTFNLKDMYQSNSDLLCILYRFDFAYANIPLYFGTRVCFVFLFYLVIEIHKYVNNQLTNHKGSWWSWSHGSWIYNYLCNQCISLLTLWVRIPLTRGVLDTTVCAKVFQWFSPVSPTSKADHHDIAAILLKVAFNTITLTLNPNPQYIVILVSYIGRYHTGKLWTVI